MTETAERVGRGDDVSPPDGDDIGSTVDYPCCRMELEVVDVDPATELQRHGGV